MSRLDCNREFIVGVVESKLGLENCVEFNLWKGWLCVIK